jgi:hypothetical protein
MIKGLDWTTNDTFAAQTMCPYETVSFTLLRTCHVPNIRRWPTATAAGATSLRTRNGSALSTPSTSPLQATICSRTQPE